MKLEPNMYIRTHFGIRKIKNIKKDNGYGKPRVKVIELDRILDTIFKFDYEFYTDEKVIKECKASHNIIDLIEIGDVITTNNLCGEVTKIDIENNKIWIACCDYETCRIEDVKSIVTKEQMESMSYKVGE